VIGAHYDHLGRDEKLALTPGADDNASGVAALSEIAHDLVADPAPHRRSILFISFSGEEEGLLGSRWYVAHPIEPLEATIAMICLDTVGRMQGNRLIALNSSSGAELPSALRGVNLGFGLDLAIPEKGPFGSDQLSFIEKGIPAFQLCTDPNADYHRSTDTPDKLNYEGIASIASFTAEVARFLADRDRALTFVAPAPAKASASPAGAAATSGRRASLGTIPDFSGADTAPGVAITGVLPGSPAEKAGLQKGDRITAIDDEKISDIEDFTAALKSHSPGEKIRVTFARGGKEQTVEAILAERK
jgi:Zn-dependent M28 family amino/carboxypeptidase